MATIPLIAAAGVIQMSMMTGGYGDDEASHRPLWTMSPGKGDVVEQLFLSGVFSALRPTGLE